MINTLIVEDSKPILKQLTLSIARKKLQLDYCTAETLTSARKILDKQSFELVILDIGLPDGSGLDLLAELKSKFGNKIKVIIFSNYSSGAMRKNAIELGADHFFDKSAEFHDLFNLLKEL